VLTSEEEKYFERYFDLFVTSGWKQFIEEITETLDTHSIEDIKDERHLALLQGERKALLKIQNFETGIRNSYDHILEAFDASEV
jgi:hypothetical protein